MSKTLPDFYTVEKILNKRIINGKPQYYVKWEGYQESDNTWEPLVNLESVKHLVREYDKTHQTKSVEIKKPINNNMCRYSII